jgi:hypothetical protein
MNSAWVNRRFLRVQAASAGKRESVHHYLLDEAVPVRAVRPFVGPATWRARIVKVGRRWTRTATFFSEVAVT